MVAPIKALAMHTALGVTVALAFAYGRCALNLWPSVRTDSNHCRIISGVGPSSPDRTGWAWLYYSKFGEYRCTSFIFDEEERAAREAGLGPAYPRGTPPAWVVSMESPLPPGGAAPSAGDYPHIVDAAFGWPLPCIAERIEYLHKEPTPVAEEQAMRQALGSTAPPASERMRQWVPETRYGVYRQTAFFNADLHDGFWPTRILWRGLILNSLCFALAIAALSWTPSAVRALRHAHRTRRGRCTSCGYQRAGLTENAPCPECGLAPQTAPPRPLQRKPRTEHSSVVRQPAPR